ncbi:hypothetical protein GCM10007962_08750 [Yeosuana aromativorans]|uniref:MAM domain-containing protein n=1 Tax=Yeosuana aromativorans TaxID=288019 RepID=A0A8J3BL16_9FLAO|nr:choice-of-anchor D domain-containing protein [Yeosuana aromativorans]GGK16711.1 hypothetical protein GCM10007962_08750 [Yeosuana aromativorans]
MNLSQTYTRYTNFVILLIFVILSKVTYSQTCSTTISSFPYSQSFETGTSGWTQPNTDNFDWTRDSAGTPSSGTGPSTGHSSTYYMYTEASSPRTAGDTANLESPCFDLTIATAATFSFWYHMYGSGMGNLYVELSTDNGASYPNLLWSHSGQVQTSNGQAYGNVSINLSAYVGQTVKIRFRGVIGSSYQSDMAIDDVALTATIASVPEINIKGNGTSIVDGDTTPTVTDDTDFGSVDVSSGTTVHTFTIQNVGTTSLSVGAISITGANAGDFSVTALPSSSVSGSGSTTFNITFNPSATGLRTASVSIVNGDSDENPYNFDIKGTGIIPTYSEVIVSVNWPNWSSENRVNVYDPSGTLLTTIENGYTGCCNDSYSTTLNLGCLLDASNYYIVMYDRYGDGWNGSGSNVTVTSGGSSVLSNSGAGTSSVGTTVYFNVSGGGACASSPEIDIQGNSNSINSGDTSPSLTDDTDFGNTNVTLGTVVNTFTIENTGSSALTIGAITFSGLNASDFTITSSPAASVAAGSTTTFNVTFNPSASGIRTATISIVNNDSDENPYTFDIKGTGTTTLQEIEITGLGNTILNGDVTPSVTDDTDFGNVLASSGTNVNTFTIQNLGTLSSLNLTGASPYVVISGANASDFMVTTIPSSTISASSSTTFAITFDPSALGLRTATVSIANNDSDENPYTFNIQGTGTDVKAPGGVITDLQLWLKSTEGLSYTDGQLVSLWQDQGNGADATVPAPGLEPTYRDDPAYNVNFNPVIDFDNDYNTASEDYGYTDTNRTTLVGPSGFYTQDIFLVTIPDVTVNSTLSSMDVFCGDKDPLTDERDGTGIGFGAYSVRFDNEILSYAVGTSPTGGSTPVDSRGYGIAHTGTTDSYSNAGIINSKNNDATTPTANILFYNGNDVGNTEVGLPQFSNVSNSRYFLGRSEAYKGSFDGRICEVITYSSKKSDADLTQERNRIQSYLAIKYGITLGTNGTSQDYVDSSGNVIWDQSANNGYNYDIAGIGRDDASDLNQKQSSSINNATDGTGPIEGILTIGLSDIYNTNNLNKSSNPTSFNDKEFLVWGNNGADLNLAASTITVNMSAGISPALNTDVTFTSMQRVWKVVENGGDIPACKVRIPQNAIRNISPPGSYLMFISDTGVFDPTADYRVLTPDGNGNLETTYDFDGTKYITFGYAPQVIAQRSIYFDGAVDYVDMEDNLDLNPTAFTISAWIKRDTGSVNASILSKRDAVYTEGYDFRINGSGQFEFALNGGAATLTSSVSIPENEWHQLAVIYDNGNATLYIDGVADTSASSLPAPVATSQSFYIAAAGKNSPTDFFAGNIDEVRIWNSALSEAQLHYIMNQEIENTSSSVDGKSIPTSITKNEVQPIPWSDLAGYYPMSIYTYTNTNDESGNNHQGALRNLDTVDRQTAPLPYQSQADGDWMTDATWLNNAVQTLPNDVSIIDGTTPINWNIVETNHNINIDTYSNMGRVRQLEALKVNSGTLRVNGNIASKTGNGLIITHYLKLDGTIDLEGESQLIQTSGSDLDKTSSGTLQRDQQGTADTYTYNYWSSPVGLSNNTTNNNSYKLPDVMTGVNFITSGYNGTASPLGIADYWIWKFDNKLSDDYSSWQHVRSTGTLLVGEGFTMKGPGTGSISTDQNYVFQGKPNNGDVNLTISSGNDYLVGNPYPSALDANQFILDNGSTIAGPGSTTGTLYFWEHWGGGSHVLAEYQGGYATYSLAGGVPAASLGTNDPDVATGGTPTKIPGRYIPVAQGFFVTAETGGTVKFNNGQRIFAPEDGTNSIFTKSSGGKNTNTSYNYPAKIDSRLKLRLGFNSSNKLHRQLLLTVDPNTSKGYDWGYDAPFNDDQKDDMYWMIENGRYVIQGIDAIDNQTIIPLGVKAKNSGLNTITIDKIENAPNDIKIYLHDTELGLYHDLNESDYGVYLTPGEYLDRFEIVFNNNQSKALSTSDIEDNMLNVYYSNEKNSVILMNSSLKEIDSAELFNILGQSVYKFDKEIETKSYQELKTNKLNSGTYILKLNAPEGIISKKVLIE